MTRQGWVVPALMALCTLVALACLVLFFSERNTPTVSVIPLSPLHQAQVTAHPIVRADAIFINTAPLATLMTLPGIGETTARQIVAAREQQPFHYLEDLMTIPGIGERRLEQIRPFLKVP